MHGPIYARVLRSSMTLAFVVLGIGAASLGQQQPLSAQPAGNESVPTQSTAENTISLGDFTHANPRTAFVAKPPAGAFAARSALPKSVKLLRFSAAALPVFSAVGVTWEQEQSPIPVTISVRTNTKGIWSAWQDTDTEEGPDSRSDGRAGTGCLWTGEANGIELLVAPTTSRLPRNVSLRLIDPGDAPAGAEAASNPQPAPSTQSTQSAVPSPGSQGFSASTQPVRQFQAPRPAINTRAQWGANESYMTWDPEYASTVKALVVHHTVSANNYTAADVPKILRGIYYYHAVSLDWGDIGYNVLVDKFGRLWEGRKGGLDRAVIGAHAGGWNTNTAGISIIGDHTKIAVSAAAQAAIARYAAWKFGLHGVNPLGITSLQGGRTGGKYPPSTSLSTPTVMGHLTVSQTACPGKYGIAILASLKTQTAVNMGKYIFNANGGIGNYGFNRAGPTGHFYTRGINTWRLDVVDMSNGELIRRYGASYAKVRDMWVHQSWNGKNSQGKPADNGRYQFHFVAGRYKITYQDWYSGGFNVGGQTRPQSAVSQVATSNARAASSFIPLPATRVADTLTGTGIAVGKIKAGQTRTIAIHDHAGVPSDARAVTVRVGISGSTHSGALSVYTQGRPATNSVALIHIAGGRQSTVTTVPVDEAGGIVVRPVVGWVHVTVDVLGYYSAGYSDGLYHSATETGLYDSRSGGQTILTNGVWRSSTASGVPTEATAIDARIRVIAPSGYGSVQARALGQAAPSGRVMDYTPGITASVRTPIPVTSSGQFQIGIVGSATHVVVDILGWWAPFAVAGGKQYIPLDPTRLYDTGTGYNITAGPLSSSQQTDITLAGLAGVPDSGVYSVQLTLHASSTSGQGALRLGTAGDALSSTVDVYSGTGIGRSSNTTVAPASAGPKDGQITVAAPAGAQTKFVADVTGYWSMSFAA